MPNLDTEEIIDAQAQPVEPVADLAKTEPDTQEPVQNEQVTHEPELSTSNRGRKKKYAEDHKEKIMIYVTKDLANLINAISTAKKMSRTEYIVSILEENLSKKKDLLDKYLELQELL